MEQLAVQLHAFARLLRDKRATRPLHFTKTPRSLHDRLLLTTNTTSACRHCSQFNMSKRQRSHTPSDTPVSASAPEPGTKRVKARASASTSAQPPHSAPTAAKTPAQQDVFPSTAFLNNAKPGGPAGPVLHVSNVSSPPARLQPTVLT